MLKSLSRIVSSQGKRAAYDPALPPDNRNDWVEDFFVQTPSQNRPIIVGAVMWPRKYRLTRHSASFHNNANNGIAPSICS
jgi:hypothetical protein